MTTTPMIDQRRDLLVNEGNLLGEAHELIVSVQHLNLAEVGRLRDIIQELREIHSDQARLDRTDDRIRFDVHDMTSDGRYVVDAAVGDSSDLIRLTLTAEQLAEAVVHTAKVTAVTSNWIDGVPVWSVEVSCPYCGRTHHHGGGPADHEPDLGLRVSHCMQGNYALSWAEATP